MVKQFLRSVTIRQLELVDEEWLETGQRRATFRPLFVFLFANVSLILLHFVVLSPTVQRAFSNQLPYLASYVSYDLQELLLEYKPILKNISWSLGCFLFYFVIPALTIKLFFKERLRDWGLSAKGYVKHLWIYVLFFVPVGLLVWWVSHQPAFLSKYPFYKSVQGVGDFLVWELFYGLQFFALEFFFRGFLIHGPKREIGFYSVFAMMMPYMMIHFQKPLLECTGAVIAGMVLGILSLRTGSIWGGVTIHVAVAWSMDWASVIQKGIL